MTNKDFSPIAYDPELFDTDPRPIELARLLDGLSAALARGESPGCTGTGEFDGG